MTDTQQPTRILPEAISDEDGETYFIQGHVDRWVALLAVAMDLRANTGEVEAGEFLWGTTVGWPLHQDLDRSVRQRFESVTYVWLNGDDDERMPPVAFTHPHAEPWTMVEVWP